MALYAKSTGKGALAAGFLTLVLAGPAAAAPEIQSWHSAGGAKVLFVPAPDLAMIDLRVVFDAGSARDSDKPGTATMTAAMLRQGAGGMDANTIAERVESIGASLSTGAERDMAWASVRSLSEPAALETSIEVLTAILGKPEFPAEDLERVRQNTLTGLRIEEQSPASVGSKALYRRVFAGHPYASDPSGTPESVAALTAAELQAFHRTYYNAANATIALVGDLTRPQAEALADRVSGALQAGVRAAPLPPVPDLASGALERIAVPSSQTHVYLGQPGMRRGDRDYFSLYVGNHILGGSGLVSLLMHEVREKRGLSYSAYSYFAPMAERGPMIMGLQTKNAQADQARAVMLETLERFVREGPTDDELEAAVKNITGGFPLRIASNGKVVEYLAMIGFYDLPLDYLDRFSERVSAVTKEQIRDAYRRRVHPDRLAVVLVGGADEAVAGQPETPAGEPTAAAQGPAAAADGEG
jgi:zinc protease